MLEKQGCVMHYILVNSKCITIHNDALQLQLLTSDLLSYNTTTLPNKAALSLTLTICIRKMPGSYLDRDIDYTHSALLWFSSVPPKYDRAISQVVTRGLLNTDVRVQS
jgi:hypothetical protein